MKINMQQLTPTTEYSYDNRQWHLQPTVGDDAVQFDVQVDCSGGVQ